MASPRLSTFIIGLIWISFFASTIGLFIANLSSNYDIAYSNSDVNGTFNKLEALDSRAQAYKDATSIDEKSGLTDIIGSYFSSAYNTLRTVGDSFDIFNDMMNNALSNENVKLGLVGYNLRTALGAIVVILIFVGVLLSAILKWKL